MPERTARETRHREGSGGPEGRSEVFVYGDRCRKDREALRAEWHRLFDRSALQSQLCRLVAEGVAPGRIIGQGTHFTAYEVTGRMKGLVLSVARPEFLQRPRFKVADWVRAVKVAQRLDLPLLAPLDIIELEFGGRTVVGLVQPYGDGPKERAGSHWGDVAGSLEATLAGLAEAGIVIDDHPQMRCRGQTPFIIDYSDFKLLSR